ncbi:MAG: hypothetical protein PUB21_12105 [Bacteroidales bacterium]|nr:hypothetical protein [Bacteroidales bacterium]
MEQTQFNAGSILFLDKEVVSHKQFSTASVFYIAAAIALMIFYFYIGDQGSSLAMLLLMVSFAFAVVGILKIVSGRKVYIHKETKCPVTYKQLYFDSSDTVKLQQIIESGDIASLSKMKQTPNGGTRLDMLVSKDMKYGSVQLFLYRSFVFEAVTSVARLNEEQVKELKV